MRTRAMQAAVAIVIGMALTVASQDAQAQYARWKGKILISDKPVPDKPEKVKKWIRKHTVTKLKAEKGGGTWVVHYMAVLRKAPNINVVNLVFYQWLGGRYKFINATDVKIGAQANVITGKAKMHKIIGFTPGKRYQLRIAIKNNRGNEVVYARSKLFLLHK